MNQLAPVAAAHAPALLAATGPHASYRFFEYFAVRHVRRSEETKTRVIERRQASAPGETVLELRLYRTKDAEVRAYISCDDMIIDTDMMIMLSRPAAEAFLDALALREKEGIANLWVHDTFGLFPSHARPTWRLQ
jgi:hypothetical protein